MGEAESFWSSDGKMASSGSAEALGDVCVGQLDLCVRCTGVGELVPGVGILEVPPQACHLSREVIVPVFLGHNLDHVELGQQIAVSQSQLVPIQELAPGALVIIPASVGIDLLWQRGVQVVIKFLQRLGQASLKGLFCS